MKTAISVPEQTLLRVNKRSAELGMSRSEFFTKAADEYLKAMDDARVTAEIDAALDAVPYDDSTQDAIAAGRRYLATVEGDW